MMENVGRFFCPFCNRYFAELRLMIRHKLIKHNNSNNIIELNDLTSNNSYLNVPVNEVFENIENDLEYNNEIETVEKANIRFENGCFKNFKVVTPEHKYIKTMLKYLSKPEIPRKYVYEMSNDFSKLLNNTNYQSQSEAKFIKLLKDLGIYIKANTVIISLQNEPYIDEHNIPRLRKISFEIKLYSLVEIFSNIFQKTNIFDIIFDYHKTLDNNELITDFTQSDLFKNILVKIKNESSYHSSQFIIPLFFYLDEFEPNNPLGSRSAYKKIGGVYSKIPCMPRILQSKMFNIFELMFFHSNDRKLFGNARLFVNLKNELNFLNDTAIPIDHKNYASVRIIPCIMMGDNLGLNQYTDRTECFNKDFCCRTCFLSRNQEDYYFSCTEDFLYTRESYTSSIGQPNSSSKSDSIFNELKNYHVAENPSADPMHDLFEGVCKYDLYLILYIFAKVKKYFTIEYLNERIVSVKIDASNTIPLFNIDFFKCKTLRMSSAEIKVFIKGLPIYIGHKIPRDEEGWSLFLLMRHITAISTSKFIYNNITSNFLRSLIPLHNKLYCTLYNKYLAENKNQNRNNSEVPLPFKFHAITHYPYLIDKIGPLNHISCMRMEQGHQVPKKTVASTKCAINILETTVKKTDYKYSDLLMNFSEKIDICFNLGPILILNDDEKDEIKYTFNFFCNNEVLFHKYLKFNNLIVKNDLVIKIDGDSKECNFVLVKYIVKYLDNVYLAVQSLKTVCFDEFLFSFEINFADNYYLMLFEDIYLKLEHSSYMYVIDSKTYVTFDEYFYFENEE